MVSFIIALVCAGLALVGLTLYKTYDSVPVKELKRLARGGDALAGLLYKPVAYGASLRLLLWLVIGLSAGASAVLMASIAPPVLAVVLVALIIWLGFVWLPKGDVSRTELWLARSTAPAITWTLERLHPVLSQFTRLIGRYRRVSLRTGLYEKSDLTALLERQKHMVDNRIEPGQLDLAIHALSFGDKLVADVLVPRRVVRFIDAKEPISPAVTDELHKSGHSRFPVFDGKRDNIVGILYLKDLVMSHKTGAVRDLMKPQLAYVHEDFTLYQTLQAFLKTKQHLFLVVNSFEEFVGIITIEDIIEQIVGQPILDEFDHYEDLRAVAAAAARKDHADHEKAQKEPDTTPETAEVVE